MRRCRGKRVTTNALLSPYWGVGGVSGDRTAIRRTLGASRCGGWVRMRYPRLSRAWFRSASGFFLSVPERRIPDLHSVNSQSRIVFRLGGHSQLSRFRSRRPLSHREGAGRAGLARRAAATEAARVLPPWSAFVVDPARSTLTGISPRPLTHLPT